MCWAYSHVLTVQKYICAAYHTHERCAPLVYGILSEVLPALECAQSAERCVWRLLEVWHLCSQPLQAAVFLKPASTWGRRAFLWGPARPDLSSLPKSLLRSTLSQLVALCGMQNPFRALWERVIYPHSSLNKYFTGCFWKLSLCYEQKKKVGFVLLFTCNCSVS